MYTRPNLREKFVFYEKMPQLKRRSISQRNVEKAKRMKEIRANDEFRLMDNRRRAKSHKIERQNDEFKTEENKKEQKFLKLNVKRKNIKRKREEEMH